MLVNVAERHLVHPALQRSWGEGTVKRLFSVFDVYFTDEKRKQFEAIEEILCKLFIA
jgi:hypothetical protein